MKTGLKVSDAMSVSPVSVASDKSILDCAKIMLKRHVGSLLVLKGEGLHGIVTEKDIVRVIAQGLDPKKTKVAEVMTRNVYSVGPDNDLMDAIHHMKKNRVRRLPVLYKGKVVGMLTQRDVLNIQPTLYEMLLGRDVLAMAHEHKQTHPKEKYKEGFCEICENFGQLHYLNDQWICAECMEEEGGEQHEEDEES